MNRAGFRRPNSPIGPSDVVLPPTQPIDLTELVTAQLSAHAPEPTHR
ncbi:MULTISPECIES: hypothetical protein [unclassified Microbacterium]